MLYVLDNTSPLFADVSVVNKLCNIMIVTIIISGISNNDLYVVSTVFYCWFFIVTPEALTPKSIGPCFLFLPPPQLICVCDVHKHFLWEFLFCFL